MPPVRYRPVVEHQLGSSSIGTSSPRCFNSEVDPRCWLFEEHLCIIFVCILSSWLVHLFLHHYASHMFCSCKSARILKQDGVSIRIVNYDFVLQRIFSFRREIGLTLQSPQQLKSCSSNIVYSNSLDIWPRFFLGPRLQTCLF